MFRKFICSYIEVGMSDKEEIKSHIQMPKFLLKRFHNERNKFFYYDVIRKFIGNNGTAESINTELGYYSDTIEKIFCKEIENPFGDLVAYLDKLEFEKVTLVLKDSVNNKKIYSIARDFLYALICRSPSFLEKMVSEDPFFQQLSEQEQHGYVAIKGIEIAKENEIFSDYIITFLINRTNVPFVLPVCGIYNYLFDNKMTMNLPVSPQLALCFMHKSSSDRIIHNNGEISMFEINDSYIVFRMNQWAFSAQIKQKWGYVVCPQKDELERLMNAN